MLRGVWSLGGRTKIGRMNLLPVNREYQYFLQYTHHDLVTASLTPRTYLYMQPSTKLKRISSSATPAVQPMPM